MTNDHTLNITTLESWLWEAACKIRGPVDAPKYAAIRCTILNLSGLGAREGISGGGVGGLGEV